MGLFMLALGSSASARRTFRLERLGCGAGARRRCGGQAAVAPACARRRVRRSRRRTAVATASRSRVLQSQPRAVGDASSWRRRSRREAAWLYKGGWPLYALVDKYSAGAPLDEQTNCLATAVYFEARGESLEGQLAVARVVMNRAASGKYPPDWCSVVKQPCAILLRPPRRSSRRSTRIARLGARPRRSRELAAANIVPSVGSTSSGITPIMSRRRGAAASTEVEKIGAHIFYRA